MENSVQDIAAERRALLDNLVAIFSPDGTQPNSQVMELMEPLLSGQMSYEEHEAALLQILKDLEA